MPLRRLLLDRRLPDDVRRLPPEPVAASREDLLWRCWLDVAAERELVLALLRLWLFAWRRSPEPLPPLLFDAALAIFGLLGQLAGSSRRSGLARRGDPLDQRVGARGVLIVVNRTHVVVEFELQQLAPQAGLVVQLPFSLVRDELRDRRDAADWSQGERGDCR
jgi:hypothetical protein